MARYKFYIVLYCIVILTFCLLLFQVEMAVLFMMSCSLETKYTKSIPSVTLTRTAKRTVFDYMFFSFVCTYIAVLL